MNGQPESRPARQHVLRLLAVAVAMFGFGFLLVPLYDVLCDITGLNGRGNNMLVAAAPAVAPDTSRTVQVQFVTTVNGGQNWRFGAEQGSLRVHPGKMYRVDFFAENEQAHGVVAQAVPSVTPWRVARHVHKTECFCFEQQRFEANELRQMPVVFMLDPELPRDVDTVTLSYTLFEVTQSAQAH
jgi:cytochrome c oxidase assembly protein subunit 11